MLSVLQEKRPLKKPRLGIPDVYLQEPKQKEDELSSMNVKHGITTTPQITTEFLSARDLNIAASKVGSYFKAILKKKEELMTLPDSGRKKQQINPKDNFWPVTARTKSTLDTWFKDLAGNKPLSNLAKKAPSLNKKEEIFAMLSENQVSMQRAAWFIKLSSAYTVAVSEAKIKKRQMPDPAAEWTNTLIKFMKDLIPKLQEHYNLGPVFEKTPNAGSLTPIQNVSSNNTVPAPLASPAASMHSPANPNSVPPPTNPVDEHKLAVKQWTYCTQLSKYMYEEGLLDKQEFLNWVLDLLDKIRSQPSDDGILKIFLPLTLQYMSDFVQTERLCRKLAYLVSKKLAHMLNNASENVTGQNDLIKTEIKLENLDITPPNGGNGTTSTNEQNNSEKTENNSNETKKSIINSTNPFESTVNDYLNCPHHRDLILQLSAILQVITIECPTALVWCGIGENRASHNPILIGSPLDHLPIPPSLLPMPVRCPTTNEIIRKQLKAVEENIKTRSKHAESKWCTDKWQSLGSGNANSRILATLDALDSHCFDRMDTNNSLETLYSKIFPAMISTTSKEHTGSETKDVKIEYVSFFFFKYIFWVSWAIVINDILFFHFF